MSDPGFAGNSYLLDINGDAGAFVDVVAKSTVRQLIIKESQITAAGAANTPQGVIDYKIPNDDSPNGFTTVFRAVSGDDLESPGSVSIELGSRVGQRSEAGEIIGQLGQPVVGIIEANRAAATTMIKLRSGTATGTTVKVTELN